jgi:uncharacterized membrane protein YqaE (UPF0057 family)
MSAGVISWKECQNNNVVCYITLKRPIHLPPCVVALFVGVISWKECLNNNAACHFTVIHPIHMLRCVGHVCRRDLLKAVPEQERSLLKTPKPNAPAALCCGHVCSVISWKECLNNNVACYKFLIPFHLLPCVGHVFKLTILLPPCVVVMSAGVISWKGVPGQQRGLSQTPNPFFWWFLIHLPPCVRVCRLHQLEGVPEQQRGRVALPSNTPAALCCGHVCRRDQLKVVPEQRSLLQIPEPNYLLFLLVSLQEGVPEQRRLLLAVEHPI